MHGSDHHDHGDSSLRPHMPPVACLQCALAIMVIGRGCRRTKGSGTGRLGTNAAAGAEEVILGGQREGGTRNFLKLRHCLIFRLIG